jgi:flavodoxin
VAKEISKLTGGDLKKIEEIKKAKEPGFMWLAFSALIGLKSKIKKSDFNLNEYDNIFVGGQIWAGHTTPAINTFLSKNNFKGKKVFLFLTQADDKKQYKLIQSVEKRIEKRGGKFIDSFFIQTKMDNVITQEAVARPVSEWITNLKL